MSSDKKQIISRPVLKSLSDLLRKKCEESGTIFNLNATAQKIGTSPETLSRILSGSNGAFDQWARDGSQVGKLYKVVEFVECDVDEFKKGRLTKKEHNASAETETTKSSSQNIIKREIVRLRADIVGMDDIINHVESLCIDIWGARLMDKHGLATQNSSAVEARARYNMLFIGPAGTGKTYTAKRIAECIEVIGFADPKKNVTFYGITTLRQYCGHTGSHILESFKKASGGILIFDEIDQLTVQPGQGSKDTFAADALNAVNVLLTAPSADRPLIIIATLYGQGKEALFAQQPGFRSRFTSFDIIPPNIDNLSTILTSKLAKNDFEIEREALVECREMMNQMLRQYGKNSGYGRMVETLESTMRANARKRLFNDGILEILDITDHGKLPENISEQLFIITPQDVPTLEDGRFIPKINPSEPSGDQNNNGIVVPFRS